MTRQRQIILEELRKVTSHPTADEVCQMVRQRLPHISLGTVYRNLDLLSEFGLILKLEMAGAQRRYDANTENHYHVRCNVCQRVEDLPARPLMIPEEELRALTTFEITGLQLEFFGLCPACKTGGGPAHAAGL